MKNNTPDSVPEWLIAEAPGDNLHYWVIHSGNPTAIIRFSETPDGGLDGEGIQIHGDTSNVPTLMRRAGEVLAAYLAEIDADIDDEWDD